MQIIQNEKGGVFIMARRRRRSRRVRYVRINRGGRML